MRQNLSQKENLLRTLILRDRLVGLQSGVSFLVYYCLYKDFGVGIQFNLSILVVLSAVSFAFLLYSFHKQKVLKSSVGKKAVGFLVGLVIVYAWITQNIHFAIAVSSLQSNFILDTISTLFSWFYRENSACTLHKALYYQKLVVSGVSDFKVLGMEVCLLIVTAILCYVICWKQDYYVTFGLLLVIGEIWLRLFDYANKQLAKNN